jgi:hypothetical protein
MLKLFPFQQRLTLLSPLPLAALSHTPHQEDHCVGPIALIYMLASIVS